MSNDVSLEALQSILRIAVGKGASDIHLFPNKPAYFRINGDIVVSDLPVYNSEELEILVYNMLDEREKKIFEENMELDFAYRFMKTHQFRVNIHRGEGSIGATIRITPTQMPDIASLGLPGVLTEFARKRKGLVIISGTAGSGKSTSLTYMVDLINRERKCKIITIEDPIEYHHDPIKSIILQREVGADTESFGSALKYALRQDPDVVVVGEMRDLESISMAITTAETGHLVFSTVHAPNAVETINRIVDVFPAGHKEQIYTQLAGNLLGVIAQTLIPQKNSDIRLLATEVMVCTTAIRNLIRRGALQDVRGQLDGDADIGMHSLESFLTEMYHKGKITRETVFEYAQHPKEIDLDGRDTFERAKTISNVNERPQDIVYDYSDKKVLIIGASEQNNEDMGKKIREDGFVSIAAEVEEDDGLTTLVRFKPSIVIIDLGLPLEGFELCTRIKKINNLDPKPRVILITSHLKSNDSIDASKAGANDFVIKTAGYNLLLKSMKVEA